MTTRQTSRTQRGFVGFLLGDVRYAVPISAVREAERIFSEQRARGATAFKVLPGQPAERVDEFDPLVEQIIVVPRVAGG